MISYQSLLLSTTVLNDVNYFSLKVCYLFAGIVESNMITECLFDRRYKNEEGTL